MNGEDHLQHEEQFVLVLKVLSVFLQLLVVLTTVTFSNF